MSDSITGFPLIREFRGKFENFFQSRKLEKNLTTFSSQGNQEKNKGFSAQIRAKICKSGEKILFKTVKIISSQGKKFQLCDIFFTCLLVLGWVFSFFSISGAGYSAFNLTKFSPSTTPKTSGGNIKIKVLLSLIVTKMWKNQGKIPGNQGKVRENQGISLAQKSGNPAHIGPAGSQTQDLLLLRQEC